jgi:lambda repressor-like predicted transcriptional regulator
MTEARRKARIAMLQRGITFKDLAEQTGYSLATIHNLLSNTASMAKGRQAITNALQVDQLWPGVFVTERVLTFPSGTELEYPSVTAARKSTAELPTRSVNRNGRVVTFIQPLTFVFKIEPEEEKIFSRKFLRKVPGTPSAANPKKTTK